MEDRRYQAINAAEILRASLVDTDIMLKAIEGARMQLSSTADELLSKVYEIRERVYSHRVELDKLTQLLK
jgi:IS5 family transposase